VIVAALVFLAGLVCSAAVLGLILEIQVRLTGGPGQVWASQSDIFRNTDVTFARLRTLVPMLLMMNFALFAAGSVAKGVAQSKARPRAFAVAFAMIMLLAAISVPACNSLAFLT